MSRLDSKSSFIVDVEVFHCKKDKISLWLFEAKA
jgi:hypothetical protein